MLKESTDRLISTARDQASTETELSAAAQSFFGATQKSSLTDANAALETLSEHFGMEDGARAGFLALLCGAMVEHGCDPMTIAAPLTKRLEGLLKASAELAMACVAKLPEPDEDVDDDELDGLDDEDDDLDDELMDEEEDQFEKVRQELALTMPQQDLAWTALQQFWRPAIAVYSLCPEARASARHLLEYAAQISEYHEAGHWLEQMLNVLDEEPFIAIEPEKGIAIIGTFSGVVDNFQLNVLLMDAFPTRGFFARRRVPKKVAEIARGKGPQQSRHVVTGVWNLYSWHAIEAGLTLPSSEDFGSTACWIWNEGIPDDIPVFEGRRVILLGPPTYPRSWQSQRTFEHLPASLKIERELTNEETTDWLKRMLAAKSAG